MTYVIKTPNSLYKGITEGVPFSRGIGRTEDKNIRNLLVNDYKYEDITDNSVLEELTQEIGKSTAEAGKEIREASQKLSQAAEEPEEPEDTDPLSISQVQDVKGIDVETLTVPQLKVLAKELKLTNYSELTKPELIEKIESA